jgi:predicted amidophosphoribosyltransferase
MGGPEEFAGRPRWGRNCRIPSVPFVAMSEFGAPVAGRVLEVVRGLAVPLDPALAACTWVPPAGEGVCSACHAACRAGAGRCATCRRTAAQVSRPAPAVTPISLFRSGDPLWGLLRRYKDAPRAAVRRECRRQLSRLLAQHLRLHGDCIAPGAPPGWAITAVPPTHARADRYPLERLIRRSPWLRGRYVRTLVTQRPPEHNVASDEAFAVVGDVAGRDLLLVDDTFTTGASVQSAASALQLAGARLLGVVVIGRVLNPVVPAEAAVWTEATRHRFCLGTCCWCCGPEKCHGGRSA